MQANSVKHKLSLSWSFQLETARGLNANFRLVPSRPNIVKGTGLDELLEAGIFQQSLLPVPLGDKFLKAQGVFYPYGSLSGDFIDYWQNSDGSLTGYLFDVTGHNVISALQAFSLRTLFRQAAALTPKLHEQLTFINNELWRGAKDPLPAAALLFHLSPKEGILQYAAAGIGPFYHYDGSAIHKIETSGFLLGVLPDAHYYSSFLKVKGNHFLMFMTDGFLEAITPGLLHQEGFVNCLKQLQQDGELADDASAIVIELFS